MRILNLAVIAFISSTSAFGSSNEDRCRSYVGGAVASAKANINMKCGFADSRWSQNIDDHFNWCMNVKKSRQEEEDQVSAEYARNEVH
jgi:hypothetical protein